jgi:hypothetical protein
MAVYEFVFSSPQQNRNLSPERDPLITPALPQQPELEEKDELINNDINLNQPEDVRSILTTGFYAMDAGLKKYFEDIQVPTKDGVRPLTVRVAGGDKTILQWSQDLHSGRIALPVMSVNRSSWRFNVDKFSPPYINMGRRFVNVDGSRMALTYRPWPALIDYTLSVWAERKRDIEYVAYQVQTRFNPLAEFRIEDESGLRGYVQLRFGDVTDNSDIDIGAEELPKVRYDFSVTMEGWLPLPEKILPTTLGKAVSLHEINGKFLEALNSNGTIVQDFFKSPGK